MNPLPRASLTVAAVHGAALALAGIALGHTLRQGLAEPRTALAFGVLIAVGEAVHRGAPPGDRDHDRERPRAPVPAGPGLGTAGALAYALLGQNAGRPAEHGVLQTVAVVGAALLVGAVPRLMTGHAPARDHLARLVLSVGFVAVCFRPFAASGAWGGRLGEGPAHVLLLLLLLTATAGCDAVLAALLRRARTRRPYAALLRDELRALAGIGSAVRATAALLALGVAVAGPWALPVFCVPLLLTQLSDRRYAAVRTTYGQTITSLARATEIAGHTRRGHARRVAELSRAVGRELGLSGAELTVLEHAALMHDIGQLSLVDPVPDGATAPLPAAEQRRIALLGGAVVRQTGVPSAVAVVVERQADPYREQPLAARIVRAVNAYDDLTGASGGTAAGLDALERLRLRTAHDYQPEVVESLARVLSRGGLTPGRAG
ncbi:metal-dependent phosphohydrolase [Streptomyces sp. NBC_01498]|uniref:HD-GYP domain-containing protein n=1 Tax=Streptomyces sp. NBC_01498 TaxID=2975870 RepID=UPI002E7B1011|nr:HD domain-containing protein [Streptomyces sp. NBC_01498]WTL24723.1 metal-dependent phosphohydrolase [Streptomyces sp. NBC_01498]